MVQEDQKFTSQGDSSERKRPENLSSWLPSLKSELVFRTIDEALDRLSSTILISRNCSSYGTTESENQEDQDDVEAQDGIDDWEKRFAINWLTRLLSITVDLSCQRADDSDEPQEKEKYGDDSDDDWDSISSIVARLLSQLTGSNATASQDFLRKFKFEVRSGLFTSGESDGRPEALTVTIREGTLSYSAIGSQTWNSAPLMCQQICSDPFAFFPQLISPPVNTTKLQSAQSPALLRANNFFTPDTPPLTRAPSPLAMGPPRRPIKVLEIGSGTGLVGITTAIILAKLLRTISSQIVSDVELILTDYHPDVLKNLQYNLGLNSEKYDLLLETSQKANQDSQPKLSVRVEKLDWREIEESGISDLRGQFDVILGSDLVYEPEHALWSSNVVRYFLRSTDTNKKFSTELLIDSINHQSSIKAFSRPLTPIDDDNHEEENEQGFGMFHLLLPLRPTFVKESEAVYLNFGGIQNFKGFEEVGINNETPKFKIDLPNHSSDWEFDKNQDTATKHNKILSAGNHRLERSNGDGLNLRIMNYLQLKGVPFGQGCQDYQYLRIGWRKK